MGIRGTTVVLHKKTQTGVDGLNNPVYSETTENVSDVLVGIPSTEEINSSISMYGKKITYVLGIPKGDTHSWTDTTVEIFGEAFRTFGDVVQGIEENIPLKWHKKVWVERCE